MILFRWIDHQTYEWVTLDETHRLLVNSHQIGNINDLAMTANHQRVIGLIPSQFLTLTEVAIPTQNLREIRQALPFELEENVLQNTEELHFAIGKPCEGQPTPVAIITKEWLTTHLQPFHQLEIFIDQLVPDVLALPSYPNSWTILLTDRYSLVKTADNAGFCAASNILSTMLDLKFQEAPSKPESWLAISNNDISAKELPPLARIEEIKTNLSAIELFAKNLDLDKTINLLQGEFVPPPPKKILAKLWRPLGLFVALIIIISLCQPLFLLAYLSFKNYQLNHETTKRYEQLFNQKLDPELIPQQLQQQSNELEFNQGDQGFLSLFAKVGSVLTKTANIKILALQFTNKQMQIHLSLSNAQQINQLTQQWRQQGLIVKTQQAVQSGKNLTVQFIITEPKP